jgi:hypothetical protein
MNVDIYHITQSFAKIVPSLRGQQIWYSMMISRPTWTKSSMNSEATFKSSYSGLTVHQEQEISLQLPGFKKKIKVFPHAEWSAEENHQTQKESIGPRYVIKNL